MRYVTALLWTCLLLAGLPAGALAGTPLWNFTAPSEVAGLSLTPDGEHILLGGGRLCLLAGDGTPLWKEWSAAMTACSADGRLVVGAEGPQLTLFDGAGGVIWRQDLPADAIGVDIASDGTRLIVADRIGKVHFYDPDGTCRATVDTTGDPDDDEETEVHSRIQDLALSEKAAHVAVVSNRGLFYYTGTGRKLWTHEGGLEGGTGVAVSRSGEEIAVASDAGVRLLNRTGALLWEYRTHRPVTALAIAGDGSRVLVGSQDNTLACLDREGEQLWTFTADGWIRDVAVSENGSRVLAGSMDRQVSVFDAEGRLLETHPLGGWVDHVALTADGTAGVAAASREVIGFSTAFATTPAVPTAAAPVTETETAENPTTAVTTTAVPTTPVASAATTTTAAPPDQGEEGEDAGVMPLLLAGLLVGGVALGAGYWYRRHRQAPGPEAGAPSPAETLRPVETPAGVAERDKPVITWEKALEEGRMREAARLISYQMTALIEERTGTRVLRTADALDACPGQREDLAVFFALADRLLYAPPIPDRGEVEALAAMYRRLAGEI